MRYNGEYCHFLGVISDKHNFAIAVKLLAKNYTLDQLSTELGIEQILLKKHLDQLMSCNYVFVRESKNLSLYYLNRKTFKKIIKLVETHLEEYHKK